MQKVSPLLPVTILPRWIISFKLWNCFRAEFPEEDRKEGQPYLGGRRIVSGVLCACTSPGVGSWSRWGEGKRPLLATEPRICPAGCGVTEERWPRSVFHIRPFSFLRYLPLCLSEEPLASLSALLESWSTEVGMTQGGRKPLVVLALLPVPVSTEMWIAKEHHPPSWSAMEELWWTLTMVSTRWGTGTLTSMIFPSPGPTRPSGGHTCPLRGVTHTDKVRAFMLVGIWVVFDSMLLSAAEKENQAEKLLEIWGEQVRDMLLEIHLLGVMRFSNWVPNKFFNGDDLTSFIRFRHEEGTPYFGDQKAELYYHQGHHWAKKIPPLK